MPMYHITFEGIKYAHVSHCFQGIKYAHVRANRNSKTNNEMNLAGVLIVIVIVFLLCHFPRLTISKGDEIVKLSPLGCRSRKGALIMNP